MSNYPPGVSGNEFEIAGPDYERDYEGVCAHCGADALLALGFGSRHWIICLECDYSEDLEDSDDNDLS